MRLGLIPRACVKRLADRDRIDFIVPVPGFKKIGREIIGDRGRASDGRRHAPGVGGAALFNLRVSNIHRADGRGGDPAHCHRVIIPKAFIAGRRIKCPNRVIIRRGAWGCAGESVAWNDVLETGRGVIIH